MEQEHKQELRELVIIFAVFIAVVLLPVKGVLRTVLFLLVYAAAAREVVAGAVKNILHGEFMDEEFLMSIASIGALCLGEFPEGIMVIVLYRFGELFQDIATYRSHASIEQLMNITPEFARVLRSDNEVKTAPEKVNVGEIIKVLPGERIPLDGEIIHGETSVDTSSLTGESIPMQKEQGDSVLSGSINLTGSISVRVRAPYEESTVSRILSMIKSSAEKKSKTERFITRFSAVYTPVVVAAAVLLAVVPTIISPAQYAQNIKGALMFLVVSCPCALVISVPLTFIGAMGCASKKGVLVKGAVSIENLAKAETVAFDKTGTVTEGKFSVENIIPEGVSEEELLEKAAMCEKYSNHPIALSITAACNKELKDDENAAASELSGRGIRLETGESVLLAGNARLMRENGVDFKEIDSATVVYVAENGKYIGSITLSDKVRTQAASLVPQLKALKVKKCVMLTGDNESGAKKIASVIKPDRVLWGQLPQDKVAAVEALLKTKGKSTVCYMGDGINDAPVIMRADVGVAMGGIGSDAAIEAADVVLTNDNPLSLCEAINISKKTMRTVFQNVVGILAIKFLVMILGAFNLAGMWFAIFADVGVMMIAVLNALAIGKKK